MAEKEKRLKSDSYVIEKGDNPLSNEYRCVFDVDGREYYSVHQYYAYQKAMYFKDDELASEILIQKIPKKNYYQSLRVKGYNEGEWLKVCDGIMEKGIRKKLESRSDIMEVLKDTGDQLIQEASFSDCYWAVDKKRKVGKNKVGEILIKVRSEVM